MKLPESDDDLRARFRELREEEAAHAPSFENIQRAREVAEREEASAFRLRPAWAAAALALFALGAGWWAAWQHDEPQSDAAQLAPDAPLIETLPADSSLEDKWMTATDSLLADADGAAATSVEERLTREIAALLHP